MVAFDTDVFTLLAHGDPSILARMLSVPLVDRTIPIVVVEEVLCGRLNSIQQSNAGKGKLTVEQAYELLEESLEELQPLRKLSYTAAAETLFADWRRQKIRVGTRDLRIAAIAVSHGAKLVTRNIRDFGLVPGLTVEVW